MGLGVTHHCDGRGKAHHNDCSTPAVLSEQHRPNLLRGHFVAPVPPRFTNFLASEIRVKKTGELEVRHGGRTFFLEPT